MYLVLKQDVPGEQLKNIKFGVTYRSTGTTLLLPERWEKRDDSGVNSIWNCKADCGYELTLRAYAA